MSRIFIDEAVKHEPLDFTIEYRKIHDWFYKGGLYKYHRENFQEGYLDRHSLTFKEFNQKHNFVFNRNIENVTEDELIRFCEYVYNMCHKLIYRSDWEFDLSEYSVRLDSHIVRLVEDMNYKIIKNDDWDLIVLEDYKFNVIESSNYVKRSMKCAIAEYRSINIRGNLDAKKAYFLILHTN